MWIYWSKYLTLNPAGEKCIGMLKKYKEIMDKINHLFSIKIIILMIMMTKIEVSSDDDDIPLEKTSGMDNLVILIFLF